MWGRNWGESCSGWLSCGWTTSKTRDDYFGTGQYASNGCRRDWCQPLQICWLLPEPLQLRLPPGSEFIWYSRCTSSWNCAGRYWYRRWWFSKNSSKLGCFDSIFCMSTKVKKYPSYSYCQLAALKPSAGRIPHRGYSGGTNSTNYRIGTMSPKTSHT